ncbi:unnamed protein product [Nezara viridula]|uniref:Gustatory receptor n=1 Tax=Nezara viridula TaxID=85310 RepID=A0A9P0HDF9_NEZVI|nr:unnamed protein product [Nezara viridula]
MVSIGLQPLTHKLATSKSYKDSLMTFLAISYLIHYPLIPLTDWLLAPTLIKYINLWQLYESQFKKESVSFPSKYLIPFLSYCTWPLSIYFVFYGGYEVCGNSFFICMMYFPILYGLYQYGLLWAVCHSHLVRQIRKLKEIVISEGLQNRVERTRKCWLLLSELVSSTGYSIGMVLTSIGMTAFMALIICSYIFFTSILDPEGPIEWWMGSILLTNGLIFFFIFDYAHKTTKEVGTNFYSVVFDQKFSQLDEENLNQLVLLLTTFSLHQPTVKFAGLSVGNRQLFVSVSNQIYFL